MAEQGIAVKRPHNSSFSGTVDNLGKRVSIRIVLYDCENKHSHSDTAGTTNHLRKQNFIQKNKSEQGKRSINVPVLNINPSQLALLVDSGYGGHVQRLFTQKTNPKRAARICTLQISMTAKEGTQYQGN